MSQYRIVALTSALLVLAAVLRFAPGPGAVTTGRITGTVKLDGQAPRQKLIDMSKDPSCAEMRAATQATAENVVVGANGGLANVVVYISQGLTGNEASASQQVTINQKGCQYVPHVVALNVGQRLTIVNADKTAHNIHPEPTHAGNNQWNKFQLSGSPPLDVTWANEEVAIPVKCNIHPWMRAFIAVVKGPFGVSNDSGFFQLDNVPPGTYTLTAWQETYGTQTETLTVAAGRPATVDFVFKAK